MNISMEGQGATRGGAADSSRPFDRLMQLENDVLDARFEPADIAAPWALAQKVYEAQGGEGPTGVLQRLLAGRDRKRLGLFLERKRKTDTATVTGILIDVLNAALAVESLDHLCGRGARGGRHEGQEGMAVHGFRANRLLLEQVFSGLIRSRVWRQPRRIAQPGDAGEPWVAFTTSDRVGLALSGGGIRSATVNLGVLQARAGKGLLGRFHYLSTVSGGGYVGGFWTRWRTARRAAGVLGGGHVFPMPMGEAQGAGRGGPREVREPHEVRHLREFSRFLIPRRGLNAEFWAAAVTVLGGIVPSLVVAAAVVAGAVALWALFAVLLASAAYPPIVRGAALTVLVGGILAWADGLARRRGEIEATADAQRVYLQWYGVAAGFAALVSGGAFVWLSEGGAGAVNGSLSTGGVFPAARVLFDPSLALLAALVVLVIGQVPLARSWRRIAVAVVRTPYPEAAWGRVMGRMLAMVACWSAFAAIWWSSEWLVARYRGPALPGGIGGGAAALSLLFYLLRDWLKQPKEETRASGLLSALLGGAGGGMARLKQAIPRLLASGVIGLAFLLAAVAAHLGGEAGTMPPLLRGLAASVLVVVVALVVFDPAALGLHEFYRGRLARCFLGAANASFGGGGRRVLVERLGDDQWFNEESGLPIHLVCCAANQTMADDHLASLHRGARSAVLSRFGIAMGAHWRAGIPLRLSSALTASAAAFNSLMGERSMKLGRAVSFVMTALNLRLGLWVKSPAAKVAARRRRWFPGQQFLCELFGMAQCRLGLGDTRGAAPEREELIHLSDGGHFENLGVYELIRRHCRYIVAVDAGEDVDFAFDDLGRAVRRVREDFGVEIEIDVAPLRPDADGVVRQHLVVGVIHYDGVVGTDKGTIVYLKPSITGDEPPDVLQYRKREPAFPHQSTGDQFFDEAQFESYRRLGEHMVNGAIGRLETLLFDPSSLADETLFWRLRTVWDRQPPWLLREEGMRLWDHARELEAKLFDPETAKRCERYLVGLGEEVRPEVVLAIGICKFLEEAWVVCELDQFCTHPAASSWMSCMNRWAAVPAVRRWWPAIKSLFGEGFRLFAEKRLHLPESARVGDAEVSGGNDVPAQRLAYASERLPEVRPGWTVGRGGPLFRLVLDLPAVEAEPSMRLEAGLAWIDEDVAAGIATWALEDLFVPPELEYGDCTSQLLDRVIARYRWHGFRVLRVQLQETDNRELVEQRLRRDAASRRQQTELIDFYRSRGFRYDDEAWVDGRCTGMVLRLWPREEATGDTYVFPPTATVNAGAGGGFGLVGTLDQARAVDS